MPHGSCPTCPFRNSCMSLDQCRSGPLDYSVGEGTSTVAKTLSSTEGLALKLIAIRVCIMRACYDGHRSAVWLQEGSHVTRFMFI